MRNVLRKLPRLFRLSSLASFLGRKVDAFTGKDAACVMATSDHACAEETARMISAAVRQSCDLVIVTDSRGYIVYVNPAFEDLAGYSLDEVLGRHAGFLTLAANGQQAFQRSHSLSAPGDAPQGRLLYRRKDGSTFHLLQTVSAVQGLDGKVEYYVVIGKEVTEQVQSEQQIERLTAVGQLAAGVAHDFNNILTVIIGNLQFVAEDLGSRDDDLSEGLKAARSAADRGTALVQQLSTFGRLQPNSPRRLEIGNQVIAFKDMALRLLPATIDLRVQLPSGEAWVELDPTHLDQVLLNLAVNARDAMSGEGSLTIELGRAEANGWEGDTRGERPVKGWVRLSVHDTGVGMDEETLERIYDPFFTTKPLGKGTGLGLSTVYGIVTEAKGRIAVRSVPGHGTSFDIYFPEVEAPATLGPLDTRKGR